MWNKQSRCPNLPDVRSYLTLPYLKYCYQYTNGWYLPAVLFSLLDPDTGVRDVDTFLFDFERGVSDKLLSLFVDTTPLSLEVLALELRLTLELGVTEEDLSSLCDAAILLELDPGVSTSDGDILFLCGETTGDGVTVSSGLSSAMLPIVVYILCVEVIRGEKLTVWLGTVCI